MFAILVYLYSVIYLQVLNRYLAFDDASLFVEGCIANGCLIKSLKQSYWFLSCIDGNFSIFMIIYYFILRSMFHIRSSATWFVARVSRIFFLNGSSSVLLQ